MRGEGESAESEVQLFHVSFVNADRNADSHILNTSWQDTEQMDEGREEK